MKLQSRIRKIFSNELLDLIASICDTKRIDSLQMKMKTLRDLLYTYDIRFEILGGATNRIALFIDGYAVKFAMDSQGYRDNLIEYSICEELQPYVTKAYETNGYILVAECVKLMSEADFIARKQDMLNILMQLSDDYLLGDVGYIKKNFTNWGVRDNGDLVILDYAYCHRATEKLFTCPVCGEGVLVYDHVFDKLMCTNKSVCHSTFTYNQRKSEQGDQVDLDMIEERKKSSLVLSEDEDYVEVNDSKKGKFTKTGKKIVVVDNDHAYREMTEAKNMISKNFDSEKAMDLLVKLSLANDENTVAKNAIVQDFNDLVVSDDSVEYDVDTDYQSERIGRMQDESEETANTPEEEDLDDSYDLDDLLEIALGRPVMQDSDVYDDEPLEDDLPDDVVVVPPGGGSISEHVSYDDDAGECAPEVKEETMSEGTTVEDEDTIISENVPKIGVILDGKEV